MDDFVGDDVPLERLEADLAGLAASIAAATCTWLLTLAAYDRREGWESWGCRSCAHWLSWKCGMAVRTAREHVQVGRSLEALPLVTDAFANGRLSYCKVRAVCRVANEDNEAELVDLATAMTGAQLERTIAGIAKAGKREDEEASDAFAARRMTSTNNHDGTHTLTLILPADSAALVREAVNATVDAIIEDAAGDGQPRREVIDHHGGLSAIRADAAVDLLTTPTGETQTGESRAFDVTLVIDSDVIGSGAVEPEAGVGEATQSGAAAPKRCRIGAQRIAPRVGQRLCCGSVITPAIEHITESGATALIDIGRRSRAVPRRLRRALEQRDNNCCQFPGCDASRRLHAHHIVWWRDDGPTDLDNLVLVCHFHHRVIHEGKWTVSSGDAGIEFFDPTGEVATGHQLPASPFALADPDEADLGSNWAGEALDYSMITGTCLHNERVTRDRRSEAALAVG